MYSRLLYFWVNLISLIGWNESIQTGENISTNESTQIYNRSCGFNSAYNQILQLKATLDKQDQNYFDPQLSSDVIKKPHCCRLQAVYSPITVKNFFTVYTAFNSCNRGNLLLRLQEKVYLQY
jgi:hypothetical protein